MKVLAKYYREIEYVLVSELPEAQQKVLEQSRELDFIKILIDGEVIGPCLHYREYTVWYSTLYSKTAKESVSEREILLKDMVLQKAG